MADDEDRASEHEEQFRAQALTYREPELLPIGSCYWCESVVSVNKIFCCVECRDDWQRVRDAQKRAGR